ncbi:cytochrome oxidase assembly [Xylanimonas cellulosilytica DSM 15894]|uniref:Cytochrome oxidase assembly n=1 Tax=Xylanimonas cellulosilytica (strain DSM 15894 / JCM 12276 / CECT 5975 / KCTC 9989 / LMG 20990 / NBRC 107835 / XIL07) TaxID=446471 RepID=D1BRC9_XYLCX|nr:COX15/CtaA family protein [Xylanimonas cellulosilytica]ACZ30384.1 cytochrome oxidase assembly [Xylanimonas cellulosilytica DSM 15894]
MTETTAPSRPRGARERLHDLVERNRRLTRGVLLANVIGQVAIIGSGGAVRLTASGLGCSEWPMCTPGSFTPQYHPESGFHPFVEFGNRTVTGVLLVIAVAVLALVWTDRSRARSYRLLGVVPLAGVLAQAVIGGVVVLLELDPRWVSLHMAVSAGLVWCSAWLLHRYGEGDAAPVPLAVPRARAAGWVLGLLLVPVVTLGVLVTGSGPHSGDDTVGYRFAIDPLVITRWHSGSVYVFVAALAGLLFLLHRARTTREVAAARRAAWLLAGVTLLQGVIGYVQYFTGLPALLVGIHMVGAALLIWATAHAVLRLRTRAPLTA